MTQSTASQGLFDLIRAPGGRGDRRSLQEAAQLAIQVEFTTIPAYLTGMYSIQDVDSAAYHALRSVVIEEMFHLNQAANTLVALGGLPRFTGSAAPRYPCYLPQANEKTTPYVGLYRASPDVFENVYAAIETPAPPHAPAQGSQYSTIAQLYEALLDGMEGYSGSTPLFAPNPDGRQRTDIYLGKFGGKPIAVVDMKTARAGIIEIMKQGEGSAPEGRALVPSEPFATYNHYGKRSDGTYGPIIGTPRELSHFIKFREVALAADRFPATYPITSNPRSADWTSASARQLAAAFDLCYSMMLDALERSFRRPAADAAGADPFFALVLPLMHQYLPTLARMLMTTPMFDSGDGSVGPNAAPTYHYTPGTTLSILRSALQPIVGGGGLPRAERDTLAGMISSIDQMPAT
jgi:hypothetical protein